MNAAPGADDLLHAASTGRGGERPLAELVQEAVEACAPQARRKHVLIAVTTYVADVPDAPGGGHVVEQLQRVLAQAVERSPLHGVVTIDVEATAAGNALVVIDQGRPVDPAASTATHLFRWNASFGTAHGFLLH